MDLLVFQVFQEQRATVVQLDFQVFLDLLVVQDKRATVV
jgi:hypothetical protein